MADASLGEAFEGESQLTDEEKTRRLVLHFAFPRTLMTCDTIDGRSTEQELNTVLAEMAWGTRIAETSEWDLRSEAPTLDPPDESLISYAEYLREKYPIDPGVEETTAEENRKTLAKLCGGFTNPSEPGQKFRPMYDQMVKCLTFSKQVLKGYNINKVCMNEAEMKEDPSLEDWQNITRFGRFQILPAFWVLLTFLVKEKRRFSIVFRSFGKEEVPLVQKELKYFCQGQHPCYNGGNKTKKPPNMSGEKGSKDFRLQEEYIGQMDRMGKKLEFIKRNAEKKKEEEAEKKDEGEPAKDAAENEFGDADFPTGPTFTPTVYEFDGMDHPPFHKTYAGMSKEILEECYTCAIQDDYEFWTGKGRQAQAGKLLLVDDAETKIQHIMFDGHVQAGDAHCVDVRNVVNGETIPYDDAKDIYCHRVNLWSAITDEQYFVKQVAASELKMSQQIVARKKAKLQSDMEMGPAELLALLKDKEKVPPKEYLYRTVIPALMPALEVAQRDRPEDPISFIAFYMLRHQRQYAKSIKP